MKSVQRKRGRIKNGSSALLFMGLRETVLPLAFSLVVALPFDPRFHSVIASVSRILIDTRSREQIGSRVGSVRNTGCN